MGQRSVFWPLDRPRLDIGRARTNAIHISDPTVSKEHAEIRVTAEGCLLSDLGSRNGTRVNGVLLEKPVFIGAGDEVTIGHVTLEVGVGGERPATPERPIAPANSSVMIPARDILRRGSAEGDGMVDLLAAAGRMLIKPGSIVETCEAFLGVAERAVPSSRLVLMLREGSGGAPVVTAARPAYQATPPVLSKAILDAVLEGSTSVLVVDAESDPRFRGRASIMADALRSLLAVPLLDGDVTLGLLYCDSTDPEVAYTQSHLEVMTLLANMLAVKITNARLLETEAEHALLTQELATARLIQRGILPIGPPALEGCDGWAFLETCNEVGGDLYDLWQSPSGVIYLLVGDVSGKGIGAALLMTSVVSSARILYENDPEPDELARRLNHMIHHSTDPSMFVTAFIARFDPATGVLRYVNAGHPRPFVVEGEEVRELTPASLPLGVSERVAYPCHAEVLAEGTLLVVYTDGIPEAERDGEFYGTEPLRERLGHDTAGKSETIAKDILGALSRFMGGSPASDDATLVVLRRTSAAAGREPGETVAEAA